MGTYSEYDEFLAAADKDDRVGDHDFMVGEVLAETWPSGDPRLKVKGALLTANNAKADITWSPPPPAAVLKDQATTMEGGKRKAIASAIRFAKNLAEDYGRTVEGLKVGDVLRVKVVKNKEGFIRIVALLPKSQIGQKSTETGVAASSIPF